MLRESDLHGYQWASVSHILNNNFSGLLLEMGLGKTVSTLTAVNWLMYDDFEINNALVIAPKRVAENVWTSEVDEWEHLQHLKISKIAGTPKKRIAAIKEKADIYTIGRDNVSWLCGQFGGSSLPFDMLIVDESSSFKNPGSVRFKALKKVQASFKRVVILTGTPAPQSLMDLWAQIYLLDRGERLGRNITAFRRDYFNSFTQQAGYQTYTLKNKQSEKSIKDKISDICISMKAKDYLELPGRVENIIPINLDANLQAQYDEFEREKIMEMFENTEDGATITALNAAALTNKLLQFANGAIYDENKDWHVLHDTKLDAVEELIEAANGNPVLIAWTFRHDMHRLMERLKKHKPRELKTGQDIKDWNARKIKVMLMHPASGGHGLNLQKGGNIIVWFGQTWSLELLQQLNARLDRQGQDEVVIINKLVAVETYEKEVIKAQNRKGATQSALMESLKAKADKYFKSVL